MFALSANACKRSSLVLLLLPEMPGELRAGNLAAVQGILTGIARPSADKLANGITLLPL
jgi:hypothetical protein